MSKRLYRTRTSKMIGGVCSGLAEYFDVDVVLIRALFVITTLGYGIGFIAYIVLWIIAPEKPKSYLEETQQEAFLEEEEIASPKKNQSPKRRVTLGMLLVVVGLMLFLNNFIPAIKLSYIIPLFLIILGVYMLYRSYLSKTEEVDYENE